MRTIVWLGLAVCSLGCSERIVAQPPADAAALDGSDVPIDRDAAVDVRAEPDAAVDVTAAPDAAIDVRVDGAPVDVGAGCGCPCGCPPMPADCRGSTTLAGCDPPPLCNVSCTAHLALRCEQNPSRGVEFFARQCTRDDECVTVTHQTDCCGNARAFGLRRDAVVAFERFETPCAASFPGCGCPAMPPVADDGRSGEVAVACTAGLCRSFVR